MPPGAQLFLERIVKLYFSFINLIKLKTFWRYEGCSTTLWVLKINIRAVHWQESGNTIRITIQGLRNDMLRYIAIL